MDFSQIITLDITESHVKEAIQRAKEQSFLDNLRNRHPNVAFDSKLRGYIGEIGLKAWFEKNEIKIITKNIVDDDLSMDIDFLYKNLDIELKTSLIPDRDGDLETVFERRDIKIIKRETNIEDLKGDIHIQIYYKHLRKKKDEWLKKQEIDLQSNNIDYIYNALGAYRYINEAILFCWIDKNTLIKRIKDLSQNKRTWSFAMREFWRCPLKNSFAPEQLIGFLKKIN